VGAGLSVGLAFPPRVLVTHLVAAGTVTTLVLTLPGLVEGLPVGILGAALEEVALGGVALGGVAPGGVAPGGVALEGAALGRVAVEGAAVEGTDGEPDDFVG